MTSFAKSCELAGVPQKLRKKFPWEPVAAFVELLSWEPLGLFVLSVFEGSRCFSLFASKPAFGKQKPPESADLDDPAGAEQMSAFEADMFSGG
ncbi:hypothetical protein Y032_0137g1996 [Ancylostoma ceylanicum]|uniref:Uncharacterized protein n=1 Tax=Ancylostoma ceylanicum TaxID=53326 RepID=A0A016T443_9BILA|nr:hypothetical protein Y032_0137g1996 [Ancylostoma ceylanicum]